MASSLIIHTEQSLITKQGQVVLIASAVLQNELMEDNLTLFADNEGREDQDQDEEGLLDSQKSYEHATKLVGFYRKDNIIVIVFLCKNASQ